jgi:hypothetical protein
VIWAAWLWNLGSCRRKRAKSCQQMHEMISPPPQTTMCKEKVAAARLSGSIAACLGSVKLVDSRTVPATPSAEPAVPTSN